MNRVILMGRLTKDPEFRANGENSVARFSVAADRRYKKEGQQSADFINCVAFGKTAEFIDKYFRQGNRILLEGRIQTGSYEKEGKKVYTTDVVAENVEFCESKGNGSSEAKNGSNSVADEGWMAVPDAMDDEGLPFN